MVDACTRILMTKYDPNNPLLQWASPTTVQKKVDLSNVAKIVVGSITFNVIMSASDYPDADITKACSNFNSEYPQHMSYSYQLPSTLHGIPANSWVLALPNEERT